MSNKKPYPATLHSREQNSFSAGGTASKGKASRSQENFQLVRQTQPGKTKRRRRRWEIKGGPKLYFIDSGPRETDLSNTD